jgi:mRNA-degrading endonuclease RelE of RelBE toxin-antitoxin system
MGEYTVTFTHSAQKELGKLSYDLEGRILRKINQLKKNPRPSGCSKFVPSQVRLTFHPHAIDGHSQIR